MLRTPKPPNERVCQYQTRNLWRSNLDRMRVIAAMRPEGFPTVEHVLNVALAQGLTAVEQVESIPRPRARRSNGG